MLKIDNNRKYYPVITGLVGLLAFVFVAFLLGLLSVGLDADLVFISILAIGALGPLLIFMILDKKNNLLLKVLASLFGILLGFMIGFGLGYVVAEFVPGKEASPIPNIVALVIMNVIYAVIMAGVTYGKKAMGFFAALAAIIGLVLGIIFMFLQNLTIAGIDVNYLFMAATFGLTLGVCIGAYKDKKQE